MDIHSVPGTKIKFTAAGGYEGQQEFAKTFLALGEFYTVEKTIVHNFHTDVYIKEFPSMSFNSCLFDDPEEIKIEKMSELNETDE